MRHSSTHMALTKAFSCIPMCRRLQCELQSQVAELQHRVALKEEVAQLYSSEVASLTERLQLTSEHAQELEVSGAMSALLLLVERCVVHSYQEWCLKEVSTGCSVNVAQCKGVWRRCSVKISDLGTASCFHAESYFTTVAACRHPTPSSESWLPRGMRQ